MPTPLPHRNDRPRRSRSAAARRRAPTSPSAAPRGSCRRRRSFPATSASAARSIASASAFAAPGGVRITTRSPAPSVTESANSCERVAQRRRRRRDVATARHDVPETTRIVHAREAELLDVAADRRLGGLETEPAQPRADLLLAREPLPGDEREDRLLSLGLRHRRRCGSRRVLGRRRSTIVPMPSGVNSSRTSACSTRPSSRCTRGTPAFSARTALSSFGIIPPSTTSARASRSSASCDAELGQEVAPRADHARHVVHVDELLGLEPDRELGGHHVGVHVERMAAASAAIDATTGTNPLRHQRPQDLGVHAHDLADEAEIGFGLLAGEREATVDPRQPDRGNVAGDERSPTSSVLTLPASTIVATSSVSRSVTRTPSTNDDARPSRSESSVICGPPPWTTTGLIPGVLQERDVSRERAGEIGACSSRRRRP